jgi:restriction endonuclease S subunit
LKIRKSLLTVIILIILTLTSCSKIENKNDVVINLFDMQRANNIAKDYLNNIISGDFNAASNLLSEDLLKSNNNISEGVSKIISFKSDESIEGNNYGYFIYNIVRSSEVEPKSDLENITFKVKKQNNEYKIDEIKSKSEKEIYTNGIGLRVIGEDGGNFFTQRDNSFIASGKFWANNHVHIVQPILCDIRYLKYFLDSCDLALMGLITGIGVPKLNQENMNKILIPIPPIKEQVRMSLNIKELYSVISNIEKSLN